MKVGEKERVYKLVSASLTGKLKKTKRSALVVCAKFFDSLYYIVGNMYGFFKILAAYDLGQLLSLSLKAYAIGFYAKLSLGVAC